MQIAELWRYPVKSMAGEQLQSAWLDVDGIPGDRALYVLDGSGAIVSARTRPQLLAPPRDDRRRRRGARRRAALASPARGALVRAAAGPDARLVEAAGPERFDILPLLVATDGALEAFGRDPRRLRPNIVCRRRRWPRRARLGMEPARGRRSRDRARRPARPLHRHDLRSRPVAQDVDVAARHQRPLRRPVRPQRLGGPPGHVASATPWQAVAPPAELVAAAPGRFVAA